VISFRVPPFPQGAHVGPEVPAGERRGILNLAGCVRVFDVGCPSPEFVCEQNQHFNEDRLKNSVDEDYGDNPADAKGECGKDGPWVELIFLLSVELWVRDSLVFRTQYLSDL
jgi:hypothetical protein